MSAPVRVGLVGTGAWAQSMHAPLLAAGPETELVGVWGRRPDAAEQLAAVHHTRAFAAYDDLIAASDAVAFAVPPDVQADMAPRAAAAGRHLLLDKPLALDVAGAERIVEAVESAGVASLVVLTTRFTPSARRFLAESAAVEAIGGRAWFIADVLRTMPHEVSPWRHQYGALFDVGPHTIDLVDAALGEVVPRSVRARGDSRRWVSLLLEHTSGAVSDLALSLSASPSVGIGIEIHGAERSLSLAAFRDGDERASTVATLRRDFAAAVAGQAHPCDAAHGLRLQRLIAEAAAALAST